MMNTEYESKAKAFIQTLSFVTEKYISNNIVENELNPLKDLFDSFAIIEEFDDIIIIDCYNEIKISLMKWERFADKTSSQANEFKQLLDHFYSVMKEIYFYEIFGFFSTSIWPSDIPELNLPCRLFCGCAEGWEKEPYLTADGKAEYAKVIRFQDPQNKEVPLCITIDNPRLLEERSECSLSDEQLETIKNFIRLNKEIIVFHNMVLIDSSSFLSALQIKTSSTKKEIKYRIVYSYREGDRNVLLPQKKYYIDMDDMSYEEAVKDFNQIKKEMQESYNKDCKDYELTSLEILHPDEGRSCNTVY